MDAQKSSVISNFIKNNFIGNNRTRIFFPGFISVFFKFILLILLIPAFILMFNSCTVKLTDNNNLPEVVAIESFLADITQNICAGRLKVESLITEGLDPHGFEPSPIDIIKISNCDVLVINGAGLEAWLDNIMPDLNNKTIIIEASKGLRDRNKDKNNDVSSENEHLHENDPHFWLSPYLAISYVKNIRNALIISDQAGEEIYNENADKYIKELEELDNWIIEEVKKIPETKRLLVTNHESFGYYADRYGFEIIGTIIPSSSTASSPSASDTAQLIDKIRDLGVKAIFLETNADPKIAAQIASESGATIVSELYTHSLTGPDGDAPTYIKMMEHNTKIIVGALKE